MPKWIFLSIVAFCLAARADDLESLHIFNGNMTLSPKLTLQLHSRIRTNHNMGDFYQARGGPILTYQPRSRLQLLSGYYYLGQETSDHRLFDMHRAWGGAQFRLLDTAKFGLDARTLVERHFGGLTDDFTRSRYRLSWTSKRQGLSPYASGEALLATHVWYGRFSGGLLWTVKPGVQVAFGYEHRQNINRDPSHIAYTMLQFPLHIPFRSGHH